MQPTFELNITKSSTDNQDQSIAIKQQSNPLSIANETPTAPSNDFSTINSDPTDQNAPNETILQLVAQIPNHPLQKIAQKLIVDRPRSASDPHCKNANGKK